MSSPIDIDALSDALTDLTSGADAPAPHAASDVERKRALASAKAVRQPKAEKADLVSQALAAVDAERNLEGARLALEAVKEFPDAMPAYLAAAVALDRLGYLFEALAFYEQANRLAPNNPSICSLIGATADRCGAHDIAVRCYSLAAQLEPDNTAHIANLGGVLRDMGEYQGAIDVLRNQLYVTPTDPDLWNTLGTVLQEQGEPEQAVTFLQEAVRLKPGFARALHNLGCTLVDLTRYEEANAALDEALALVVSPADAAEMRHARGQARFGAGRLHEGWQDYEARFDPLTRDPVLIHGLKPRWDGQDPHGKRLLILGEQGLGDEIILMNALQDAIDAVGPEGKVTLACEHRLVSLCQRSFPQANVIAHRTGLAGQRKFRMAQPDSLWDEVDVWAPMGDLCRYFRPTLEAFPRGHAYLRADPARVAAFQAQLAGDRALKVGVLWKSLVMTPKRRRYFAPFSHWGPLLRTPGVSFYSLQYGDAAEEEAYALKTFGVTLKTIEGLDLKDDLEGVAAAALALDLLVGPMNASTNIAAACGAPVWFVHRYGSWTQYATDGSPFYPHTRQFCAGGQWRQTFETMAKELAHDGALRASAA